MADIKIIQLTNDGEGNTTVDLDDVIVTLVTRYNYSVSCWVLDIIDIDDNIMLAGLMLIPNVDLLAPYAEVKEQLGSFVIIEKNEGDYMSPDLLGTNVKLLWYSVGDEIVLS